MFGHNDDQQNFQDQDQNQAPEPFHPVAPPPDDQNWQHPGAPIGDDQIHNITPPDLNPPTPQPHLDPPPANSPDLIDSNPGDDDLVDIKQKALNQLTPLVDHLDQAPEEKFRTLMMMIQASDDQSLVKSAYEAAQNITDEKSRAQALLDIVNEINYFSQSK